MNRRIGTPIRVLAVGLALAAMPFVGGCAGETSTGTDESDQSSVLHRAHMVSADGPQNGTGQPGEQQTNALDLHPDTNVTGPVPDPWAPRTGPVPDPWNPGDPHHPKTRWIPRDSNGDNTATAGSGK